MKIKEQIRMIKSFFGIQRGGDIPPPPVKRPQPEWWPSWLEVTEKYPIGRKFEYLGRAMVVTNFKPYIPGVYFAHLPMPTYWPAVVAQYADERGVIHEHEFGIGTWKILLAP